ncbi:hypothetical protein [Halorarius litoreus]|uniref:hypothetical protein n=1 Tax=Halorarius litoreus TaxID=2962676 RepID=UPI0020CDE021|nr:hypothetical protein [Halorarius litoreus]
MDPERGDMVRSADPFKLEADRQRPWLVVNNDSHPFGDEQYIALAISTKEYEDSVALAEDIWEVGGVPRQSFVSPWAVHSPRREDLVAWQGRVTGTFVDRVVDAFAAYLQ